MQPTLTAFSVQQAEKTAGTRRNPEKWTISEPGMPHVDFLLMSYKASGWVHLLAKLFRV